MKHSSQQEKAEQRALLNCEQLMKDTVSENDPHLVTQSLRATHAFTERAWDGQTVSAAVAESWNQPKKIKREEKRKRARIVDGIARQEKVR